MMTTSFIYCSVVTNPSALALGTLTHYIHLPHRLSRGRQVCPDWRFLKVVFQRGLVSIQCSPRFCPATTELTQLPPGSSIFQGSCADPACGTNFLSTTSSPRFRASARAAFQ